MKISIVAGLAITKLTKAYMTVGKSTRLLVQDKRHQQFSAVKRKILIIVENTTVPPDRRVWREAQSLHANGYDVSILAPRQGRFRQGYESLKGIRIYRHPMPKEANGTIGYLFEYSCALFWEFLYACWIYFRQGFDVIQGCNPPDTIFLVALPFKLFGVKYIFDHHDANPELYLSKYSKKGALYKMQLWLESMTFRVCDVVISTNTSYQTLAIDRGGVESRDVFIVRNGPDLNVIKPVTPNPLLKHGKRYLVGYAGIMSTQEGIDILLDVVQYIKDSGRQDIHFTCVGGGPAVPGLREMARDRCLEDTIDFTGFLNTEELLEILSTADVCVDPGRPCEINDISTMVKTMEYMALGKPIVQFDLREGRLSASEASLYADNQNQVPDFAAKLLWLLDRPLERARMGAFGRQRIEKELGWQYSVEHLLAAYQRAFTKRK